MSRRSTLVRAGIVVVSVLVLGSQLAAQTLSPPVPPRDTTPPVRRVPVGTGIITGIVIAADTGRPLRNARVMLNGSVGSGSSAGLAAPGAPIQSFMMPVSRFAVTNEQGQFVFQRLPAGQFNMSVSRNQFLTTNYGQKKPGGPSVPIVVADGQQVKVTVPMTHGGVITGTITGEDGEPLSNAQVRGLRYSLTTGVRRLQSSAFASTDDRGVYRLFGLQPGEYVIAATPQMSDLMMAQRTMADAAALERALASAPIQPPVGPGQPQTITMPVTPIQQDAAPGPPPGYLPTYFPSNTASANASTITIGAGEERSGVDVQVQLVQASMIQGTIVNPASQTTAVQVWLQNQDPAAEQNTPSTRANPNGRFTFQTVAPGRYVVLAQTVPLPQSGPRLDGPAGAPAGPPRLSPSEVFWGRAEVSVEATSALDLSISLQPGRSISGSVVFDASTPPDLTQARVMVTLAVPAFNPMPVPSPPAQAPVGPDGRFSVTGVIPGKYTLRGSWGVQKSAIVGADDVLDFPLDFTGERDVTDVVITLTDRTNELSGVLTDASGKPTVDHTVVIASRDSRYWTPGARRILTARPGVDGRYTFRNIPAGDYLLAAVTDLEQGGQYDQEFLKSLLGASMTITLHDGARQTQDIRLAR